MGDEVRHTPKILIVSESEKLLQDTDDIEDLFSQIKQGIPETPKANAFTGNLSVYILTVELSKIGQLCGVLDASRRTVGRLGDIFLAMGCARLNLTESSSRSKH